MKLTLLPLFLLLVFLWTACDDDPEPRPYAIILDEQGLKNSARIIGDTEGNAVIMSVINEDGNEDIRVRKMNPEGHILWERTYGTSNDDLAYVILQTSDGNHLIGGFTHDSLNRNDEDFYLFKIDTEGNILWQKTFDNDLNQQVSSDRILDIYEDSDGILYLAVLIEDVSLTRRRELGNGIIALNSEGEELWRKAYFQYRPSVTSITVEDDRIFIFDRKHLIIFDKTGEELDAVELLEKRAVNNPGILKYKGQFLTASRNRIFAFTKEGEITQQTFFDRGVQIVRVRETVNGYVASGFFEESSLNTPVTFILDTNLRLIEEKTFTASLLSEMTDAVQIEDRIFCVGHYSPAQGSYSTMFLEIFYL